MGDNTSGQSGFLLPAGQPAPLYDDELVDALQPIWAGISGVPGTMFRPRWQPDDVPNQPEQDENWAALGIARTRTDAFAFVGYIDGFYALVRSEELDVLTSFYGPRGKTNAELLRDGLSIGQNRDGLDAMKAGVVTVGDAVQLPALLHGKWQRRVDVTVTLRRVVERHYGVLSVRADSSGMGLDNEQYLTQIVLGVAP